VLLNRSAAAKKDLSFFSRIEFKNIEELIGGSASYNPESLGDCVGYVDFVESIENERNYMRVAGWIFDQSRNKSPRFIWLINQKGKVVGFALAGEARTDVAEAISKHASLSGFRGYFLQEEQGGAVTVFDPLYGCGFSSLLQ